MFVYQRVYTRKNNEFFPMDLGVHMGNVVKNNHKPSPKSQPFPNGWFILIVLTVLTILHYFQTNPHGLKKTFTATHPPETSPCHWATPPQVVRCDSLRLTAENPFPRKKRHARAARAWRSLGVSSRKLKEAWRFHQKAGIFQQKGHGSSSKKTIRELCVNIKKRDTHGYPGYETGDP